MPSPLIRTNISFKLDFLLAIYFLYLSNNKHRERERERVIVRHSVIFLRLVVHILINKDISEERKKVIDDEDDKSEKIYVLISLHIETTVECSFKYFFFETYACFLVVYGPIFYDNSGNI